jgi:hypothetical protein
MSISKRDLVGSSLERLRREKKRMSEGRERIEK